MPLWTETHHAWIRVSVNEKITRSENRKYRNGIEDSYRWVANIDDMNVALTELIEVINAENFQVRSITPILGATSHSYSHAPYNTTTSIAYAAGGSYTEALLVVFDKQETVSDAEFAKRAAQQAEADSASELATLYAELTEAMATKRATEAERDALPPIEEKRKLVGGPEYRVGTTFFDSRSGAESYVADIGARAAAAAQDVERLRARIKELEP